jgi:cytochrome P450
MAEDFDFYSDEFQNDPGATFSRMIERCPFHRSEKYGWYSVFRYRDIAEIVKDNQTYSARFGPGPAYAEANVGPVLVSADPPLHGKQKQAIVQGFNARTISAMEGGIRTFVNERIDAFIDRGECDLVQDLAVPIPMWVICRMLDLPYERDRDMLRNWVEIMAGAVFSDNRKDVEEARDARLAELVDYFGPHIESKIAQHTAGEDPGDDLIGLLVKARVDGEPIGMSEMLSFAQFLLVAGSGTTTNLIGNFFKRMMDHPDQYARLKADPGLLDQAIEEVLRYDAPVHGLFRTNNVPVTLGGLDVPPDSKICLMWGAANRDPAVFDHPERFDITRDIHTLRKNMTFGQGLHKCLGAPLARLECKVAVQEFTRRVSTFEPNGKAVPYPYATLNGLDALPVRFTI